MLNDYAHHAKNFNQMNLSKFDFTLFFSSVLNNLNN